MVNKFDGKTLNENEKKKKRQRQQRSEENARVRVSVGLSVPSFVRRYDVRYMCICNYVYT